MYRYLYKPPLTQDDVLSKSILIHKKIDQFFETYNTPEEACVALKAVTRQYLNKLAKNDDRFICLHLEGAGGLGKNHWVRKLAVWLEEALETSLPIENVNIRGQDSSELEGAEDNPGQILNALARIGLKKKPYGILFFDEASWLNDQANTAKKVFEPNLEEFEVRFLEGFKTFLKGFLIIFATNDEIKDPALASRFSLIKYPTFNKEKLAQLTLKALPTYLEGTGLRKDQVIQEQAYKTLLETAEKMRDVDILLPKALEKIISKQ